MVNTFSKDRAWALSIAALAAALIALVTLVDHSLFGLEWILQDRFTRRIARLHPPSEKIAIVVINDKSLQTLEPEFGRWPTRSRLLLARAINELADQGARLVAVDILLSSQETSFPEDDRLLAEAMQRVPTILGVQTTIAPTQQTPELPASLLWSSEESSSRGAPSEFAVEAPQPLLTSAAAGLGSIRLHRAEGSAITRSYPVADRAGETKSVASLAVEVARTSLALPRTIEQKDGAVVLGGKLEVPTDATGAFRIAWHGRERKSGIAYHVVDFDKLILAGFMREERGDEAATILEQFASENTRGRIVLIGATAAALFDLRSTPLASTSAGVEIHANAVDDLLHSRFLRQIPRSVTIPLLFAVALVCGFLLQRVPSQATSAAIAVSAASAMVGAEYLLLRRDIIFFGVAPALAILLTWAGLTVQRLVAEQKQSRLLKTTFGRYVSPQILEHILAHPEKVDLGGERRELTILFSDIRGFTSISEAAEPEEVVEMLNIYLTRMVDILLNHGGTLDKFIGDAVMGFWNAPAGDEHHARHAVECAIEMIEETARLRAEWEAEGKAALRIGIGINTGDAVAGNIGSRKVFGYTVIGDAVNLASRLEGKNKDYGTEIIISESTLMRIGEGFDAVYLDDVKVKGKDKAVKIYEIKGLAR